MKWLMAMMDTFNYCIRLGSCRLACCSHCSSDASVYRKHRYIVSVSYRLPLYRFSHTRVTLIYAYFFVHEDRFIFLASDASNIEFNPDSGQIDKSPHYRYLTICHARNFANNMHYLPVSSNFDTEVILHD